MKGGLNADMRSKRVMTSYSSSLLNRMRNVDYLEKSLSTGSKNRLNQYMSNLSISRGLNEPVFDKELVSLARQFSLNQREFDRQISYLNGLKDEDGYRFSRNLKIYNTTESAMSRFAEPDHASFRWNINYQNALLWLKSLFSNLKLTPLSFTNDDDVKNALPKVNTHSGFTYILSGNKYKGENMQGIVNTLKERNCVALKEGTFNNPIMIGFRTQASGEYDDEGTQTNTCKHKLRVISMVDLITIINELRFSNPLQNFLCDFPYYAGGKNDNKISQFISHCRANYRKFLSIDYSSFDQTISSWLIEDAFDIIKSAFILDDYNSKLFNIIVHDFIHKDFILHEGILHSDKGVPSGSMFTQIIDSLVNILVVKTYFNSINTDCSMMVMGDDNIIFTRNEECTIQLLSSYIMKNFGLIIKIEDKSSEGGTNQFPKFLSRYWTNYGSYRHPYQLLSRLAFPERKRLYNQSVTPAHVLLAFCLTYDAGMRRLINIVEFRKAYPISEKGLFNEVDSRYLPGALAYIREYVLNVA